MLPWMSEHVIVPAVTSILGLVATIVAPVLTAKLVRYLNRRWNLDIDAREENLLRGFASEIVHNVEAQLGPSRGEEKLRQAILELGSRAAAIGIDVGEDVLRAKIESALHWERSGVFPLTVQE